MNSPMRRFAAAGACLLMVASAADAASPRRLAVDGRISGEITGADRLNLNDGSRSVGFEVDLREGQAVAIEASAVFCGRLALFAPDDAGRDMVVREFGSSECVERDGRQVLARSLVVPRSGRYTLAFSGRGSADYGPFALALNSIALQADRELVAGDDVHGLLDGAAKQIPLKIADAGRYEIDLVSSEFDPVLRLSGEGVSRENDDNGENLNSRLIAYLEPGDYRLEVDSVGESSGMYQLRVVRKEANLPPGVELSNGGDLAAGEIAGLLQGAPNEYRLVVAARSLVDLAADSDEVDPKLTIAGPDTTLVDDDSGSETNAHLAAVLEPGTYTVRVDPVGETDAGMYRLRTAVRPAPGSPLRLRAGTAAQGRLVSAEQARYALTVDRAGRYEIGMSSTELDPVLHLVRDGEIVESNDDADDGDTNARLAVDLEPGEYVVIATGYDGGAGSYRLLLERR